MADQGDDVDAFAETGDGVFEIDLSAAGVRRKCWAEDADLLEPGVALGEFEGEGCAVGQSAEDFLVGPVEEFIDWVRVECPVDENHCRLAACGSLRE